jgi:hypothetical protein
MQVQPTATPATQGWADFTQSAGSSNARLYVVGNATVYFAFEAAGQSVEVTLPREVWPQSVAVENVPAEQMSKLKGGTVVGVALAAPQGYGYDVTFGYDKPPTSVVAIGNVRSGEYRPTAMATPAPVLVTARLYSASPPTTVMPGATATATPSPSAMPKATPTAAPSPTATPKATPTVPPTATPPKATPTAQPGAGLPDLVIDDVWLYVSPGVGYVACGGPTVSKSTGGKPFRLADGVMDGNLWTNDFNVWYTVKNIGAGAVPKQYAGSLNAKTSWWMDNKYGGESAVYGPPDKASLDPGQTTSETVPISVGYHDLLVGAHTVTLRVNTQIATDGSVYRFLNESNYSNNEATLTITKIGCQK